MDPLVSALHEAASSGEDDLIKLLIKRGVAVNGNDPETGATALHKSAAQVRCPRGGC